VCGVNKLVKNETYASREEREKNREFIFLYISFFAIKQTQREREREKEHAEEDNARIEKVNTTQRVEIKYHL
jgi:hypothetical protein